jgi:DNA-binding PadR family transcriptional regulator
MARTPVAGPASDPELLILSSLAKEPKHGYAIMKDVERFSGTKLGPGTLYTAITRLVEKGWIEPEAAVDRQRPYRISESGAAFLKEQITGLRRIAAVALRRLRYS